MKCVSEMRLLAVILLCAAAPCAADKQVVEHVRVVESPGEHGAAGEIVTWIGEQRYARADGLNNITTIFRKDIGKMYIVMHDSKEVIALNLPLTLPEYLRALFQDISMNWEVNRRPEQQRIDNWECNKVVISGRGALSVDVELWVTNQTQIDTRAYHAMVGESLKLSPIYREMDQKLYSITPHFAIRTTTTVEQFGLRTTTVAEVQSIAEKTAPVGTYDPPADYAVRDLDFAAYVSLVRSRQPAPGGR